MSKLGKEFVAVELCALPVVRRSYQAVVAGLAVFILALVVWREPFKGYLAEVHLSGPQVEGIDLTAAVGWIKQADKHVAAVATAAGEISTKPQIRATFVGNQAHAATNHLDSLAEKFLFQYLPDQLQGYRHATLNELRNAAQAAHEREDRAHLALESLRQRQLAEVLKTAGEQNAKKASVTTENDRGTDSGRSPADSASLVGPASSSSLRAATAGNDPREKTLDKLHLMRLELASLLANFTDEHPDVITLRSQIQAIEQQLGISNESREVAKPERTVRQMSGVLPEKSPSSSSTNNLASDDPKTLTLPLSQRERGPVAGQTTSLDGDESAAILQELAAASRERQEAEHKLSDRMQELANQGSASQWSAAPAHLVTRIGGTPRTHTILFAALLAMVFGVVIFRAAEGDGCVAKIDTTGVLASSLELPVIGNLLALRDAARRMRQRFLTPRRLHYVVLASEIVVGFAVLACVGAIFCEPTLARQVVADPFGTLSEVAGRFGH
ncbi:MAG TPA: hypothetical protein VGI40_03220 [Pirellulaceae bacterium]|jgi:hypothetical protein